MGTIESTVGKKVVWPLLLGLICTCAEACLTAPDAIADYREVSVHAAVSALRGEQIALVATMGSPQAVWARPFGLYEWVYCSEGVPDRRFVFDLRGRLLGQGWGGDERLCSQAAWTPVDRACASVSQRTPSR